MAKGSQHDPGDKGQNIVINLPESVKKKLPRDFNIGDIGKIDLREAESIANEDILFISENELIEGLEDFDLIPLKNVGAPAAGEAPGDDDAHKKMIRASTGMKAPERRIMPEIQKVQSETDVQNADEIAPPTPLSDLPAYQESSHDHDDGKKWISLSDFESYDEHGRKWVPLGTVLNSEEKPKPPVSKKIGAVEQGVGETAHETAREEEAAGAWPLKKPRQLEGYVESDDEYIIWDMPSSEARAADTGEEKGGRIIVKDREITEAAHPLAGGVREESPKPETRIPVPTGGQDIGQDDDEVVISTEDLKEYPKPVRTIGDVEMIPVEYQDGAKAAGSEQLKTLRPGMAGQSGSGAVQPVREAVGKKEARTEERYQEAALLFDRDRIEKKPGAYDDMLRGFVPESGRVIFVDDGDMVPPDDRAGIFGESELDKIISGIVQIDEGSSYLLSEADVEEDRERIAVLTDDLAPAYDDMFVDLDYKYGDDELDYIHTAIAEEDYGSYIREIDEFFGTRGGRAVPTRVELLGMTADEFDTIEDMLFKDEFKDIHLYDRYHLYEFDRSAMDGRSRDSKSCRYLLPAENSIMDVERNSIESDVSSHSALIFEEDVEEIREQLKKRTGKTDAEIVEMFERAINVGTLPEQPLLETSTEVVAETISTDDSLGEPGFLTEDVFDITDRVVILDDKADVERFISGFPERKQMNIKMLLKYLDGLFEKLPEETIKKFASSDYFELYLKVLNELGV